ncbi:MAG: urea ABC transporter permease subunit UrtB [Alphaproteobacteria bacterium]
MSVHDFWTPFAAEPFLNALVIGITLGAIWLLAALGLTIIYGTMGVINMAHGEFIMVGAYLTFVMQSSGQIPWLACLPLAFIGTAILGWIIERLLIRYLYQRPLDTLLATWGVSLILIQGVRLIFGGEPQYVAVQPHGLTEVMDIAFIHVPWLRILILAVTIGLALLTWAILYKTVYGIRVRAVMQNKEMAASFGINAQQVYGMTFAYGAGLAGVAGAMFGGLKTVFPDMGLGYIVEAFLVVVTGGGNLLGSVVSGAALGELNSVFSYFTNTTFARFVLFVLIVIFLRFYPQGLFPEAKARR